MCSVSFIGDHYGKKWGEYIQPLQPTTYQFPVAHPSQAEFDELKARVEAQGITIDELRRDLENAVELLKRAKAYDDATGQPDCEKDERVAVVKQVARIMGVDLGEVFK
jgi:predicted RNase H-like HicB family nuclease